MSFKLTIPLANLHDEPRDNSTSTQGVVRSADVLDKIADATDGFWNVRVVTPGSPRREGFIRSTLLAEVAPNPEIDKKLFFGQVAFAAQAFGANRDYLYALAMAESEVRNIGARDSSAFGPFQFIPNTWNDLVRKHPETGITEGSITDPGAQATFAAIYSSEAMTTLTGSLGQMPSANQLYLAHLLGPNAAVAVLRADLSRAIDVPLRVFYRATPLGEGFVDKVLSANRGILTADSGVRTTSAVLNQVAQRLAPGLAEAVALAKDLGLTIEKAPGDPGEEPPWLSTAKGELAKDVVEHRGPGGHNPEITLYFTRTTHPTANDDTPWCAAFVSFCMAESHNAKVEARNLKSALAHDWIKFGFSVGKPTVGALAVLHPLVAGSTGHVGFVTGEDGIDVVLLGGNQHNQNGQDAVCEAKFNKADVLDYRWIDFK